MDSHGRGLVLSASNEATRIITDISFEQLWPDENGVVGSAKPPNLWCESMNLEWPSLPIPGRQVLKTNGFWMDRWADRHRGAFDAPFVRWFEVDGSSPL